MDGEEADMNLRGCKSELSISDSRSFRTLVSAFVGRRSTQLTSVVWQQSFCTK